jgi:hypothetical protein
MDGYKSARLSDFSEIGERTMDTPEHTLTAHSATESVLKRKEGFGVAWSALGVLGFEMFTASGAENGRGLGRVRPGENEMPGASWNAMDLIGQSFDSLPSVQLGAGLAN